MTEPNPWQITYGTPADEWADRIRSEFSRMRAERDEAQYLVRHMQAIIVAFVLAHGGEIRLPYSNIEMLPHDMTFTAWFDTGNLFVRIDP